MTNITKIIAERRSVRTFNTSRPVSDEVANTLRQAINNASSPFGGEVSIALKKFDIEGSFRPSTYGTITGAQYYFLMGTDSTEQAQLSLGFRMEQVVLKATALGLGTCWIAATFKGTTFANAANFPPSTPLQVVMPVGYPAEKKSLTERIMRAAIRSTKRRPLDELFIVNADSPFLQPLEMMRLAPSSTNSQPWRADVIGGTVYFYYENKSEASVLDLGIGLSHFYLAAKAKGIEGSFSICKDAPEHKNWIPLVKFESTK